MSKRKETKNKTTATLLTGTTVLIGEINIVG
jgi:hypothetical protein